ncbi:hypothetical protein EON64_16885, partial [archaeon]
MAAAGYSYASGFAETIAKMAPDVFGGIKDVSGDVLDFIKDIAPAAFSSAQQVAEQLGTFVMEQGPAVLDGISNVGGSVIGALGDKFPDLLKGAGEGASTAKDGAGVAASAASNVDSNDLSQAVHAVQGVAGAAAGAAAKAASSIGANIDLGSAMNTVGQAAGAVGGALGTVGDAIANVVKGIDAEQVQNVAQVAFQAIGTGAAVFPFLLPLQIAMRDIGNAVQQATYNRESANMLKDRCEDCSKLVEEMAPKITRICSGEKEQEGMVKPFVDAVNECTEFLKAFSSKGFLSHMFKWKKDNRSLMMLDKRVSDTLQNLSMRVDGKQIELQLSNAEKLDEVFLMLSKATGNATSPESVDPAALAEVVKKAGAENAEAISSELQGVGFKLEEIDKALATLLTKFDSFENKLDAIALEQKEREMELKNILIHGQAEAKKHAEQITLATMRLLAEKGGGKMVEEKFATTLQVDYLAKRSRELKTKVPTIVLIHPHGVGVGSFKSRDGQHGTRGPDGSSFNPGRMGRAGERAGADGEDGEDGEDGLEGGEGDDGIAGEDCDNFEVMIEFIGPPQDG